MIPSAFPTRKEKIYIKEEKKVGECIIYFFIINFPETQYFKMTNIYYLTVSMGQDSWHSLTGSPDSGFHERLPLSVDWCCSYLKARLGKD